MIKNIYCCKCGELKTKNKDGHGGTRLRCTFCAKNYAKAWALKNKEHVRQVKAVWMANNKEHWDKKNKEYRLNNKDKIREKDRIYWAKNKNKKGVILNRKKYAASHKEQHRAACLRWRLKNPSRYKAAAAKRYKKVSSTPEGRLIGSLRTNLRHALKLNTKSRSTEKYLGIPLCDLMPYLLSISKDPNITAENYGSYWWVDHILPISSFDHSDDEQVRKCWRFSNLQPLEKTANMRKHNMVMPEFAGALNGTY